MPKLSKKKAKAVNSAESTFKLLDAGLYPLKLKKVDTGEGQAGPYWQWEFQIPEGHDGYPRELRHYTSLSEDSDWKMRETFEAFGVSPDTDTDDLIGKTVRGEVIQATAQSGKMAGQLVNYIQNVMPLDTKNGGKKSKKKGKKSPTDDDDPPF